MNPNDVQRYTRVFSKVDTDHDGKITGEQARQLFLSWQLPKGVLTDVLAGFCDLVMICCCVQPLRTQFGLIYMLIRNELRLLKVCCINISYLRLAVS